MTLYTITNTQNQRTGAWMHYVRDADGDTIRYHDERLINATCDSHAIAERAAVELDLPKPDWIDHDGEYIHFGYNEPETSWTEVDTANGD